MGKQGTPPPAEKSAVTDNTTYVIPGIAGALSGSTGPNERMNKMTTSLGFGGDKSGMETTGSFSKVKKPLEKTNTDVRKSKTEIISDELLKETEDRTGPGSIYDESTYVTVPADN